MQLGNVSVSLTVKDLAASLAFYKALGFEQVGGNAEHNYLILRNGAAIIGLFQGMFDKNALTFNPGWNAECETLDSFEDVRDIQKRLEAAGLSLTVRADDSSTGPAHIALMDPDGNPVLIDQHVPNPGA